MLPHPVTSVVVATNSIPKTIKLRRNGKLSLIPLHLSALLLEPTASRLRRGDWSGQPHLLGAPGATGCVRGSEPSELLQYWCPQLSDTSGGAPNDLTPFSGLRAERSAAAASGSPKMRARRRRGKGGDTADTQETQNRERQPPWNEVGVPGLQFPSPAYFASAPAGSSTMKVEPDPSWLSTRMSPP